MLPRPKAGEGSTVGWGFRKTIRLGPGLRLTLGKKSIGISGGIGPVRAGYNSRSGSRERVTLRGTGLYYEQRQAKSGLGTRANVPPRRSRPSRPYLRVVLIVLGVFFATFFLLRQAH
jgi:hypothetical protein